MASGIRNILSKIGHVGSLPSEDEDLQLKKALLTICAITFAGLGFIWSILYMSFGQRMPAIIPLCYSTISCISILYYAKTRKYRFFRFSQLLLILLLPSILQYYLGGFTNGSAVILWSLISPMGALLFDRPKLAVYWFVAFISLVITGGVLQEQFQLSGDLPKTVVLFFFVLNLTGVGFMIFLLVSYFVRKKDTFQQKSENLLLNIMPKDIVPILKNRKGTVADHYKDASILFADLVDFTPLASQLNPKELVKLLNRIFSHFDTLVDKHDLEKIKTIGDCYMVAAGVPKRRPDHAEALVQVALDMLEYIEHEMVLNRHLHLRLGISSGEVVAGVIGNRKFAYDMWGDAVNLASRMESQGKVGRIQITKETYDLVKHHFNCESGGMINVKGKGEMEVWLVKP